MKKIKTIIAFCILATSVRAQNSYGAISYPYTGSNLSSGTVTAIRPGFLMAGSSQTASTSGYNFTIDRMDIGGASSANSWYFQNGYKTFGVSNCVFNNTRILDCVGVSAIEGPGVGPNYALAGAMSFGCYFAKLNQSGGIVNTQAYSFGGFPSIIGKPLIAASVLNSGDYYIVGSFDGKMYMLRVNSAGIIQRSYTSDLTPNYSLTPRAIMESPYPPYDLTVVGWSWNSGASGSDGFFYQIDSTLATVSYFNRYDFTNLNGNANYFLSLTTANSVNSTNTGFLVGGGSVSGSVGFPGTGWMVELDTQGSLIWSTVIKGTTDVTADKITAVVNRLSAFNGVYECYGSAACNSGITVYKLDETGVPYSVSFAGQNDEFVYNSGSSSQTWPVDMTYNQLGSTYDEGLHIFGNLDGTGPGNHYFVQAYFSGEEGCNTPIALADYDQTAPSVTPMTDVAGTALSMCNFFSMTSSSTNPYNAICGPVGSIGGASNNKIIASETIRESETESVFSFYPNPVNDKIKVNYKVMVKGSVKIDLLNSLGVFVKSLINIPVAEPRVYHSEIDFASLNISNGIYFIRTTINNKELSQKLVYHE